MQYADALVIALITLNSFPRTITVYSSFSAPSSFVIDDRLSFSIAARLRRGLKLRSS